MEPELIRTYYPEGTNGKILYKGRLLVYTIELPWKNNLAGVSCIPEGIYDLVSGWSPKFGRHLQIMHVSGRELILMHPANEALLELKGCIAPVRFLSGAGKGNRSSPALCGMKILMGLVGIVLDRHEPVFITIKSK
jgi:hypothetical protein